MQQYVKKGTTIVVDAAKVGSENVDEIANWAQAQIVEEKDALTHRASEGLNVKTPSGKRRASRGAYVVKWAEHFFVVPGSDFEATYTPVVPMNLVSRIVTSSDRVPDELVQDPFEGMPRFSEGPKP